MNIKQNYDNCCVGKDEPTEIKITINNDFGKGVILGASAVAIVITLIYWMAVVLA